MTSRRVLMTLGGLLSVFYLLNPTAGLFEILPDALPLVGNIDEAMAATLLLACLREYGLDLTAWRRKGKDRPGLKGSENSGDAETPKIKAS